MKQDYYQQRKKVKEARAKIKEKTDALQKQIESFAINLTPVQNKAKEEMEQLIKDKTKRQKGWATDSGKIKCKFLIVVEDL